jgi:hypothetical protein
VLLLPLVLLTGLAGLATWLVDTVSPLPLDVRITVEPYSLCRYEDHARDHAGNLPLGAVVRITNFSKSTAWFIGYRGAPMQQFQQIVEGQWESSISAVNMSPSDSVFPEDWSPLRTLESMTILAGPVSEKAAEIRVGLLVAAEKRAPTEADWVFSPAVNIVRRGHDFFPEQKVKPEKDRHNP